MNYPAVFGSLLGPRSKELLQGILVGLRAVSFFLIGLAIMAGIAGEHLFGQVHHIRGLFYVSTLFFHVNYLPLWPLRSYVVMDNSQREESFQGSPIPMNFLSVVAGYLRGWLGAATMFLILASCLGVVSFYVDDFLSGVVRLIVLTLFRVGVVQAASLVVVVSVCAVLAGALWFMLTTHTWWFLPVQLVLLWVSTWIFLDIRTHVPDAARIPNTVFGTPERRRNDASYVRELMIGNAVAVLYSLTRLLTPGSRKRARKLAILAGIPEETIAAHLGSDSEVYLPRRQRDGP